MAAPKAPVSPPVAVEVLPLLDERTGERRRVGRRIHRNGSETVFVLADKDPAAFVTEILKATFRARGFRVADSGPVDITVQGRMTHFQVVARPAVAGTTRLEAKVALALTVANRADRSSLRVRTESSPTRQTMFFRPEEASRLLEEAALEAAELLLRDLRLVGRTLRRAP